MSIPSSIFLNSVPAHCTPTSPYLERLSSAFHTCIPTPLALLSTALGLCSIVAWLFAQVPQIYKNWRLQSASGLSIYFLLEWLAGDVTNLAGAILTDQASWQISVATYYVLVDVCLSGQYFWYVRIRPWLRNRKDRAEWGPWRRHGSESDALLSSSPSADSQAGGSRSHSDLSLSSKPEKRSRPSGKRKKSQGTSDRQQAEEKTPARLIPANHSPSSFHPTALLGVSLVTLATASALPTNPIDFSSTATSAPSAHQNWTALAGTLVSWTSTLLYLCSRLPQIYKNTVRRSTSGLSPYMFLAAFMGNLFYSAAIIANPLAWASYGPYGGHGWAPEQGSIRGEWVANAAPFWFGAAGVLALDATVGLQFLAYGEGEKEKVLVIEQPQPGSDVDAESEERGRWQRVSGWMRGWVPSPSRGSLGKLPNGETRPLIVERTASGFSSHGGYGSTG